MKKQITFFGIIVMMVAATALIAAGTQQDKGKGQQKEQKGNDKADKAQKDQGKNDNKGQGQGNDKNDDKGNQGKNDGNNGQGKGNDDKDKTNQGKSDDKGDKGNGNNRGNVDLTDKDFKWDRETFKDRDKIRKGEKVTICHKFNNNNEPAVTIRVSSNALKAHMNHGDMRGDCPATNNTFSDRFLKRRTDYYNELQEANEQVLYSQSVLDYAKMRLALAQQQLASTQASQLPMAQIQQRQAVVTELEQNVSLLETLVGVAAQLVVNKLSN